ncbi:MAG: hypothetical protein IPK26_00420 [Planctomycetes bacterium]|nr:hypothetical protein [Planctomycetota bacterium]
MSNSRALSFLWSIGWVLAVAAPGVVAQTTRWSGFASSDWGFASNWSNGVPDSTTSAIIGPGPRAPRLAANGACRDLQVFAGGVLQVDARLDVHGSVTVAADVGGTGSLRLTGVQPTGSVVALANRLPTVEVMARDVLIDVRVIQGNLVCRTATGRVRWQGDIAVTGDVFLACQSVMAAARTSLTVDGDFSLLPATGGTVGSALFDNLILRGDWESDSRYRATSGRVIMAGSVPQTLTVGGARLYSLEVRTRAVVTAPAGALMVDDCVVGGALTVVSSAAAPFDVGDDVTVPGTLAVQGTGARVRDELSVSGSLGQQVGGSLRIDGVFTVAATGAASGLLELHGDASLNASIAADIDSRPTSVPLAIVGAPNVTARSLTVLGTSAFGSVLQVADVGFEQYRSLSTSNFENLRNCSLSVVGQVRGPGLALVDAELRSAAGSTLTIDGLVLSSNSGTGLSGTTRITGSALIGQTNTFQSTTGVIIFGPRPATAGSGQTQHSLTCYALAAGINTLRVDPNATLTVDPGGVPPPVAIAEVYGHMVTPGSWQGMRELRVYAGGSVMTYDSDIEQVYVEGLLQAPYLAHAVDFIVTDSGTAEVLSGGIGAHAVSVDGHFEVRGSGAFRMRNTTFFDGRDRIELTGTSPHSPTHEYNLIGAVPEVEIQGGTYRAQGLVVANDLRVTGTTAVLAVGTATVGRNAAIGGARISSQAPGSSLTVLGDLSLQTATTSNAPPEAISCGGNWTSNASFQPAIGSSSRLTMTRAGNATMTAAGPLPALTIATGCVATLDRLDLRGGLDVRGSLAVTGTQHTIRGATSVTGALSLPVGSTGTFASDAATSHSIAVPATSRFPRTNFTSGSWTITDLTTAGPIDMQSACDTLTVERLVGQSTATFAGSRLRRATSTSSLTVSSTLDLRLQQTVTTPPDIRASGNVLLADSFQPTVGRLTLDRTTGFGSLIASASVIRLHDLVVERGRWVPNRNLVIGGSSLTVGALADFDIGVRRMDLGANATALVSGQFALAAGGVIQFGANGTFTTATGSRLRLFGTATNPVSVLGTGLAVSLGGLVEASNFVFSGMNAAGVRIASTATFGAVPNDFRGGSFTGGSAVPGSVLLDIARTSPFAFHELDFDSTGGVTHGAAVSGSAPVVIVNAEGDRAGEAHERDPMGLLTWQTDRTVVRRFAVQGGFQRMHLDVATDRENAVQFRLGRATTPGGPFATLAQWAPTGAPAGNYSFSDPQPPDTAMHYRLEEQLLHGEWRQLGIESARSFPATNVGDVWFVGPGSMTSIADALAVATAGGKIVVGAGTYPGFVMTRPVSIYAAGDGPVVIVADAPVVVQNLVATDPTVELVGLTVQASPTFVGAELLALRQCRSIVVLDQIDLTGANAIDALRIDGCPRVKVQSITADRPTRIVNATVFADHSTLALLDVRSSARITTATTTMTQTSVEAGSVLDAKTGPTPRLRFDAVWQAGDREAITVEAEPSMLWIVLLDLQIDFRPANPPFDMLRLSVAPATLVLGVGAPPGGAELAFNSPAGSGSRVGLQVVAIDAVALQGRYGTFGRVMFLP